MSTAGIIGGIVLMLLQFLSAYLQGAPARKGKADAITKRDLDELESGMARVDRLHGNQSVPPGGSTVL